jgi:hypothetical protein
VLEHVQDPVDFVRHHATDLNPGGLVVLAVPDTSPYIAYGDVSMILHEHLNYYDEDSPRTVVEAAGCEVLELRKGGFGGVLYCIARVAREPQAWKPRHGTAKFSGFVSRVESLRRQVEQFILEGLAPGNSLGCYVPLRALPYLTVLGIKSGFRLFDDDPGLHGKFFDGFDIAVENRDDLAAEPVSHLLIMSFAFGDVIRNRLRERLDAAAVNIRTLSDFDPERVEMAAEV